MRDPETMMNNELAAKLALAWVTAPNSRKRLGDWADQLGVPYSWLDREVVKEAKRLAEEQGFFVPDAYDQLYGTSSSPEVIGGAYAAITKQVNGKTRSGRKHRSEMMKAAATSPGADPMLGALAAIGQKMEAALMSVESAMDTVADQVIAMRRKDRLKSGPSL